MVTEQGQEQIEEQKTETIEPQKVANLKRNLVGKDIIKSEIVEPIEPKKLTKLKKLLIERNIMQQELAIKANVEKYQISELCSGKRTNIMLDTAKRICKVLQCKLDDAFGED